MVKKLSLEIGHKDRRFLPGYIHNTLMEVDPAYRKEHEAEEEERSPMKQAMRRLINLKKPSKIFGGDAE